MNRMRDNVSVQRVVLALKVFDFLWCGVKLLNRCRTGGAKGVVRIECVMVIEMDLFNWRFGNKV